MSKEKDDKKRGNHLSAKELLRNKGICYKAWNEWEESSRTLPKIGANKQFEPSGSWLENKQIEKGLNSREFLLGIERVSRLSQLSIAEWIPEQKKAKVTKKSGNEWNNFGHEINGNMYLIPEEALFLLETECLELIWEGISMSIQQAYDILLDSDNSNCSIDEYRVYSQLARLGYHLKRFHYEIPMLQRALDETVQRKKVIVDPENGLWMAGQSSESATATTSAQKSESNADTNENKKDVVITINGNSKNSIHLDKKSLIDVNEGKPVERKTKHSKVEIISEQTILSPIKIVKDALPTLEHSAPKWPGTRIQRNVKLLPKRNDKASTASTESSSSAEKRKLDSLIADLPEAKKTKHQVIELSDDEIEEIPRPMSRMEMLNCLPNIADRTFITENILSRYIPRGVTPRSTYLYDTRKLRSMNESDKRQRASADCTKNDSNRSNNVIELRNQENAVVPYQQHFGPPNRIQYGQSREHFQQNTFRPFAQNFNQFFNNGIFMNTPGIMQQMAMSQGTVWQNNFNRAPHYNTNMFRNLMTIGHVMRHLFMQNMFQMNFHQNQAFGNQRFHTQPQRYMSNRPWQESSNQSQSLAQQSTSQCSRLGGQKRGQEFDKCTFIKIPKTSSWTELKQKWREAKTITIDDEEGSKIDDPNEIQVVDLTVKPLTNSKNCLNIAQIFERLRIIKSAPNKIVRRKKSNLKISYNIYSNTQPYKKSNPGLPMFHLVVISHGNNNFLQPVEINRLQQDGKGAPIMFALISNASISYIQSGIVNIPNLS